MTFKENFIAVVKHKGKILRERSGSVRLPFGSEYSILLKNLETVNAVAEITVDGKDVLEGNGIIVAPNTSTELKGFMGKGITVRNKFRFIEKTDDIRNFRGDRPDDGIIRIKFRFEKREEPTWYVVDPIKPTFPIRPLGGFTKCSSSSAYYSSDNMSSTVGASASMVNEDGITVKGSKTRQRFNYSSTGTLEDRSHVIVIRLMGSVRHVVPIPLKNATLISDRSKKVNEPVTTRTKIQCSSCGRRWNSRYKFCPSCSTFLD
jgi:hypothetical protein